MAQRVPSSTGTSQPSAWRRVCRNGFIQNDAEQPSMITSAPSFWIASTASSTAASSMAERSPATARLRSSSIKGSPGYCGRGSGKFTLRTDAHSLREAVLDHEIDHPHVVRLVDVDDRELAAERARDVHLRVRA